MGEEFVWVLQLTRIPLSLSDIEEALHKEKVPLPMTFDDFVEALIAVANAIASEDQSQSQAVAYLFSHYVMPLYDALSSVE